MNASFGSRLCESVRQYGPIVAGVDPHASLLEQWGVPDTAEGARTMSHTMLDACEGRVAAIKPQSAFFERFGSAGIEVLEELLAQARDRGILTILDVKRGDIGSTMGAYAESYLRPGSPLEADAITVSPYLGFGSLEPCLPWVREHRKGLFVLCLTSNPDGPQVQHARSVDGDSVGAIMAHEARRINGAEAVGTEWGSVGLVVGATIGRDAELAGVDLRGFNGPLLAPGFGAQGAGPEDLKNVFGQSSDRTLVSMSRSILGAGPAALEIASTIDALTQEYRRFPA